MGGKQRDSQMHRGAFLHSKNEHTREETIDKTRMQYEYMKEKEKSLRKRKQME